MLAGVAMLAGWAWSCVGRRQRPFTGGAKIMMGSPRMTVRELRYWART
jgi:hypothetical protein